MTLDKLIGLLEEMRDDLDGDVEVRLMSQPSYPFEYAIRGVTCSSEFDEPPETNLVYLVEGRQIGYGNRDAWELVRN